MPTILVSGPYRLFFDSADGREPPHIHVGRDQFACKAWLTRVEVAPSFGFGTRELGSIVRIVTENQQMLLEGWHEFFSSRSPDDRTRPRGARDH